MRVGSSMFSGFDPGHPAFPRRAERFEIMRRVSRYGKSLVVLARDHRAAVVLVLPIGNLEARDAEFGEARADVIRHHSEILADEPERSTLFDQHFQHFPA